MTPDQDELRFDGRVAIVTGAGGNPGLGRSYALALAARGAKVVVNDLGGGPDGRGVLRAHADAVAEQIVAAGGEAVADSNSVADEQGAAAVVQTALDSWGKVDIVVNNAGVFHAALFEDISSKDLAQIVQVHLFGNIWICRAVWPLMKQQRYGRVINVSSGTMLGAALGVTYGAAKAGIYGLTRGLAVEGKDFGIKVNAFGPTANTAGAEYFFGGIQIPGVDDADLRPELVAPALLYLAHEQCAVSGKFINAGARRTSELYFAETAGHTSRAPTPEDVRDNLGAVIDHQGARDIPDPGAEDPVVELTPRPYEPGA